MMVQPETIESNAIVLADDTRCARVHWLGEQSRGQFQST